MALIVIWHCVYKHLNTLACSSALIVFCRDYNYFFHAAQNSTIMNSNLQTTSPPDLYMPSKWDFKSMVHALEMNSNSVLISEHESFQDLQFELAWSRKIVCHPSPSPSPRPIPKSLRRKLLITIKNYFFSFKNPSWHRYKY